MEMIEMRWSGVPLAVRSERRREVVIDHSEPATADRKADAGRDLLTALRVVGGESGDRGNLLLQAPRVPGRSVHVVNSGIGSGASGAAEGGLGRDCDGKSRVRDTRAGNANEIAGTGNGCVRRADRSLRQAARLG